MNSIELDPHLVKSIGWTLLHSLWQGAVIFVVLVLLLAIFRNKSPQLRYILSCVSLLILMGWMGFTFISYLPEPYLRLTGGEGLEIHEFNNTPVRESTSYSFTVDWRQNMRHKLETFIHLYARQLVGIWLLGAFIFTARWLGGVYFTYRLRSVQTLEVAPQWQDKARRLAKKLGVRRPLSLLESAKVEVPLIIGHLKPVILLPIGMLGGLTPQQVEAILVHELAHIRRYDFLINLLLSSLEILLFYHPIFWWISNKIMEEREQCCDDLAIKICGNARFYARTLLMMEEKRQQKSLAMAYQGKKHHLLQRVKRICLSSPATYRREFGKAGLALGLLLVLAVATWARMPASVDQVETTTLEEVKEPSEEQLRALAEAVSAVLKERPVKEKPASTKIASAPVIKKPVFSQTFGVDTIPPKIPPMASTPALPPAPKFPYSAETASEQLRNDRSSFRKAIDQYEEAIDKWRAQVEANYIGAWEERQSRIQAVYDDWKEKLERQNAKDDIAYAIALQKGDRVFEDALRDHEKAMSKTEDEINEGLEKSIEAVEDILKDHEDDLEDHDKRMEAHRDRMGVHSLRMSVHRSRMDVHRARMDLHRGRMDIHRDRMEAHRVIMKAFKKELFAALIKDGLMKEGDKDLEFLVQKNKVEVNGTELSDRQAEKYLKMLKTYGFEMPKGKQWGIRMKGENTSIGTFSH